MNTNLLSIKDFSVEVEGKKILDNLNLEISAGASYAIMGPNGSGKSTLCYALMGHPKYKITSGKVSFMGKDLLVMSTDERAKMGIFLGFQYPKDVAGITFGNFLRQAVNIQRKYQDTTAKPYGAAEYFKKAGELMDSLKMERKFIGRNLNEGFSGGEKKRAEIVQMMALQPKLALLDEIDSGLDIDALKDVAAGINLVRKQTGMGLVLITHYQRLLRYVEVDRVHIMVKGRIVKSGGKELVEELEKNGYKDYL